MLKIMVLGFLYNQHQYITEPRKIFNTKKFHYKKLLTFTARIYIQEIEYRI